MITFRDPPPLQVRVESLKETVVAPPKFVAPLGAWLTGLLIIAITGTTGLWRENRDKGTELLAKALANSLPRQTESGVLRVLPLGSDMQAVRKQLDEVHATCGAVGGALGGALGGAVGGADAAITCLGAPFVRANTYTRLRIRFTASGGKLTAVIACPTFVHWSSAPVPDALADRVAHPAGRDCWRDEANLADNEWTYATLPDRAFTVAVVHGADSVRRAAAPTADTLIVRW